MKSNKTYSESSDCVECLLRTTCHNEIEMRRQRANLKQKGAYWEKIYLVDIFHLWSEVTTFVTLCCFPAHWALFLKQFAPKGRIWFRSAYSFFLEYTTFNRGNKYMFDSIAVLQMCSLLLLYIDMFQNLVQSRWFAHYILKFISVYFGYQMHRPTYIRFRDNPTSCGANRLLLQNCWTLDHSNYISTVAS